MSRHDAEIGEQLAEWGKVAVIETRGRLSGRPARAAVGFIEDADGSVLVAAGSESADWVLNLRRAPDCRLTIGEQTTDCRVEEVTDADRARTVTELILKYGTPAERLGRGPVFRLRAVAVDERDG